MQPDINSELIRSPWVAGAMGAIVALRGVPGLSWAERLFNVFAGLLIAGYVSPAASGYLGLEDPTMQSAAAFICGLFGLNLMAEIVEVIRTADLGRMLPWKK